MMWVVRGENRYQVVMVDREDVTLANRYGAEFAVDVAALVANGYVLECEPEVDVPVWWLDAQGDVHGKQQPELLQPVSPVQKEVFALFDF